MSKYLLKFIKYILLSSKDWTAVRLLSNRDVHLCSTSISRVNIDILYIELVLKSDTTTTKTYCKRATSDEDILGIRKEMRISRLLSLLIISDSQKHICISNSQRDFVPVLYISSWLALWHQERKANFHSDELQKQPPKWRPKRQLGVHG